ncbi:Scr1 family TA system antitoxin-like transcriptional regulator [Longispora sp. K20-0274]|uniref:Scr1 family TA system antitoxin-like transcriptional regulator n=1 Tax=Longispora sp. K20-0274 TaxID=3088255 RepID=UPI003999D70D
MTSPTYRPFRDQVRSGQEFIQHRYTELTRSSQHIRNYCATVIPGHLQTAEYARARMVESRWQYHDDPTATPEDVAELFHDDIEAGVTQRLARGQLIHEEGRTFDFLIAESALRFVTSIRALRAARLQ